MANNDVIVLPDDENPQPPQGPIYRRWPFSDELLLLTTLADERHRSGELMSNADLYDAVRGDLRRTNPTVEDVASKVNALKSKFRKAVRDGGPANNLRDGRLYDLSMVVWPEEEEE